MKKPAFDESAIPAQAAVFKDRAVRTSVFVNDAAKAELEKRVAETGITGLSFRQVWGESAA